MLDIFITLNISTHISMSYQYCLVLVILLTTVIGKSQDAGTKVFSPAKEVLTIGDLDKAPAGKLPPGWKLRAGRNSGAGEAEVKKINGEMAIVASGVNCAGIEPVWDEQKKLGSTFSFEFYYYQENGNDRLHHFMRVYFDNPSVQSRDALIFTIDREGKMDVFSAVNSFAASSSERETTYATYPAAYDPSKWHHTAIAFNNGTIEWYVDGYLVLTTITNVKPEKFWIDGQGVFGIRQLKLARDENASSFDKIITEKKMQTHAIVFDVNSATIKPESMGYIQELADWLKQNNTIKLKIVGHTDSTGDATLNLKLSTERAAAIKKELSKLGVDAKRLSTHGHGASKPRATNNTAQGKALNRRVEFENN